MSYLHNRDSLFEIELAGTGTPSQYTASVRVQLPNHGFDVLSACKLNLSIDDLRACRDDIGYTQKLTERVFQDRELDKAFARARDFADYSNSALRIRIIIAA